MTRRFTFVAGFCLIACAHSPAQVVRGQPAPAQPVQADEPGRFRVAYAGEVDLEAHLENPGDTIPLTLEWAQTCTDDGLCLVEQTVGTGQSARTERIWSTPETTWSEGASTSYPPLEAAAHRRLLSSFGAHENIEISYAHPRLGTVVDIVRCGALTEDGVPESITVTHHGADVAWRGALVLRTAESVPPPVSPAAPPSSSLGAPEAMISRLREGVWQVSVPQHDARSFVLEFDTFVAVVEAPWSSEVGELILDTVAESLPDKPVRYVMYTHHHPHYTGGLRAFIAEGATVVAPHQHAEFVRSIAEYEFDIRPDRLAKSDAPLKLETFDGRFVIEEGLRRVEVFDIGEQSKHTSAYMLFHLPAERLLIEGDIGWFVAPDGAVHVGERSEGLLNAIDERELAVDTLLQTWPVVGQGPALRMEDFRAAVQRR